MKIFHLIFSLKLGGIETMIVNIANEQCKTEKVSLVIINDMIDQDLLQKVSDKVKVFCFHRNAKSRSIVPFIKLYALLMKENPDIIHVHSPTTGKLMKPFMNKVVYTIHDTTIGVKVMSPFKHYYAISQCVANDFHKRTGKTATVVYNGIQVDRFKQRQYETSTIDMFRIVQVSRLMHEKKGQDILIKAVAMLRDKGIDNIHVDFIGEGESYDFLDAMIKSYGLTGKICLLGAKPYSYVSQHLCDYNLLVQPSRFEGFGLTVAEAIAAKIPVLVSKNDGPMEIIDNGNVGYYFENGDERECAAKIEEIMNTLDRGMVERAYEYVLEHFNVERTAQNYIKEYRKLIG